jgi:ATP-binding protein involved in chromosome partitioning
MDLRSQLLERLDQVLDPELGASLVELSMVGDVTVSPAGDCVIPISLTTLGCPLKTQIERDVKEAALQVEGITSVELIIGVLDGPAKEQLMKTARALAQRRAPQTSVPLTTPVIMIASGKGGVGKSSVTANLAVGLATSGLRVGVLDADIWGFSLTRLLAMSGDVEAVKGKMQPLVKEYGSGSIKLLSMGFLAKDDQALLWRGLMVQKAVAQFIEDADWSGIDYLLIDTPPGTGDIPMTLSRLLPQMVQLVVTTPALAAQVVARRAADFARKSNIRVVGVIENMSPLTCTCGATHAIFGEGGGQALSDDLGVPLVAQIPLNHEMSLGGDSGEPAFLSEGQRGILHELTERIRTEIVPERGAVGCSARMLESIERALR